ncbi:MAG TPA: hypothetical protein VFB08_19370 [Burkholderiales bacterium]|nr:hypothetical protein [Burkholderiales bacterium]
MDPIQQRFNEIEWTYATGDPKALKELEKRIAIAARKRGLITYSDLVRGVTFDLPNLQKPRTIDVTDWQEIDRAIVGDFLGYISKRSYEHAKLFSSALVVSKMDGSPGEGFYSLLKQLGLIPNTRSAKALALWAEHVAKAHTWFAKH